MKREYCPSLRAMSPAHEYGIRGTPHSAMTWYVCQLCGFEKPRGPGSFYRPPQANADDRDHFDERLGGSRGRRR
jgi:hypothetical protein